MERVNLSDVRDQMVDIGDRATGGSSESSTRNDRTAGSVMSPKVRVDVAMLDDLHKKMPLQTESAGVFIRRMRDDGY